MKESAGPLAAAASSTTSELAIIEEVQADSPPLPAAGPAATNTNFEYEDSEWDVGIGNLIIDLDADIEKNGKNHPGAGMPSSTPVPSTNKSHKMAVTTPEPAGLKMKIKRTKPGPGTRSSETKHEIVKTDGTLVAGASPTNPTSPSSATINNNNIKKTTTTTATTPKAAVTVTPVGSPLRTAVTVTPVATAAAAALTNGSSAKSPPVTVTPVLVTSNGNNPVSPPPKKWKTGHLPSDKVPDPSPPPTVLAAAQPIPAATNRIGGVTLVAVTNPTLLVNGVHPAPTAASSSPTGSSTSGSGKADACVGTCSASTMTEPDCLGPCEPGTAVTLEGIVWHETEGGVLVVNVTWRGKTYVGTLMDCTKNEWAPPRLCDSPTSDAESRAPKGRAKRGRGASSGTPVLGGPTGDKGPAGLSGLMMMNDISPMHSKLRNGAKGRRGGGSSGGPPSSPAKEMLLLGAKRKSSSSSGPKPVETDAKRSRSSSRGASSPITTMDPATQAPAGSPSLIECPEPNCSKKYRHINGLKYHQSHAHSTDSASSSSGPMAVDEDSNTSDPPAKSEEAPETPTAPFTGKVPMPPPQEDSLSSPIKQQQQQQPASTAPSPAPAGQPTTVIPEGQAVSADWTEAEQLKKKHKKKSKDKDRDRSAKKSVSPPPTPAVAAVPPTNGTTYPAATGPTSPVQPIVAAPPVVLPESREEVQSPAYSDISDANDQSPSASMMLDAAEDITKKEKMADLPVVVAAASAAAAAAPPAAALAATFGMYHPFYGQPPLTAPPKEPVRILEEVKAQQQQPLGPQQAPPGGNNVYQPFGFVPPYPAFQPPDADKKMVVPVVNKTDGSKPPPEKLPPPPPPQQQQQQLQQQQQQPAVSSYDQAAMMYQQHQRMQQQEADLRRFYNIYPAGGSSGEEQNPMFSPGGGPPSGWMVNGPKGSPLEQPRKPSSQPAKPSSASSPKLRPPSVDRKEKESKPAQFEGVKPTMETHGPPPPPGPTSMSPFHPGLPYPNMYNPYGLPFDPSHPAYRMLGPHGPPPPPTHHYRGYPPGPPQPPPGFQSEAHALEMFQHQYYAALAAGGGPSAGPPPSPQSAAAAAAAAAAGHKIHELTERAMKSPPASPASSKSGFPPPPPPPPPSSSSPFSSNPPSGSYLNNKPHLLRP